MQDKIMIVRVSGSNRITVPRVARERLGIKAGDRLLVDVQGGMRVLASLAQDYAGRLAGLHGGIWADVDSDAYLHREREAWEC